MSILNHRLGRYLSLLPLLIMVLAIMYFSGLTTEINHTLLEEKKTEKHLTLDLIDEQIDLFIAKDADWNMYDYESILAGSIASLDAQPFVFAALYDENLQNVSARTPSYNSSFEPLENTAFHEEVLNNETGHAIINYTPTDSVPRDMHVYYRWVPTDASLSARYLTIVAVSEFSITNHTANWVGWGATALIVVVTILNIAMVALLSYLGHIYSLRDGTKHRRRT